MHDRIFCHARDDVEDLLPFLFIHRRAITSLSSQGMSFSLAYAACQEPFLHLINLHECMLWTTPHSMWLDACAQSMSWCPCTSMLLSFYFLAFHIRLEQVASWCLWWHVKHTFWIGPCETWTRSDGGGVFDGEAARARVFFLLFVVVVVERHRRRRQARGWTCQDAVATDVLRRKVRVGRARCTWRR